MRFRNSVVCIIVMNALQPNDMLPDAILANDNQKRARPRRYETRPEAAATFQPPETKASPEAYGLPLSFD